MKDVYVLFIRFRNPAKDERCMCFPKAVFSEVERARKPLIAAIDRAIEQAMYTERLFLDKEHHLPFDAIGRAVDARNDLYEKLRGFGDVVRPPGPMLQVIKDGTDAISEALGTEIRLFTLTVDREAS